MKQGMTPGLDLLQDPYNSYHPLDSLSCLPFTGPGTLVAIRIHPTADVTELKREIQKIRQHAPWVPIIGRISELMPASVHHIRLASAFGLRAFVHDSEPLQQTLRGWVTRPSSLGREIAEWVEELEEIRAETNATWFASGVAHRVSDLLRGVFVQPCDRVGELAERSSTSERSLRVFLARHGLPPARAWIRLARLLPDALALQRKEYSSLAQFAAARGYYDQPALCRALREVFGCSPREISDRIGWESLLWRWFRFSRTPSPDAGALAPSGR